MNLFMGNDVKGRLYKHDGSAYSSRNRISDYFIYCAPDCRYAYTTGIGFYAHTNGMYCKLLGSDGSFYYMYCGNK